MDTVNFVSRSMTSTYHFPQPYHTFSIYLTLMRERTTPNKNHKQEVWNRVKMQAERNLVGYKCPKPVS